MHLSTYNVRILLLAVFLVVVLLVGCQISKVSRLAYLPQVLPGLEDTAAVLSAEFYSNFTLDQPVIQLRSLSDQGLSTWKPRQLYAFYSPHKCPSWNDADPDDGQLDKPPWLSYFGLNTSRSIYCLPRMAKEGDGYNYSRQLLMAAITAMDTKDRRDRRRAVAETWGNHTNFYFVSREKNLVDESEAEAKTTHQRKRVKRIELPLLAEHGGRLMLGRKVLHLFSHLSQKKPNFDFYLKADDDVYVHVRALKRMLRYFDPDIPMVLGHRVGTVKAPSSWMQRTALTPKVHESFSFCHGGAGI